MTDHQVTDHQVTEQTSPTDPTTRMQRQLRAMAAVNRQLQAQLDGSGGRAIALPAHARGGTDSGGHDLLAVADNGRSQSGVAADVRRASAARDRIQQLELKGNVDDATLVQLPGGRMFVIEGGQRREIKSGLLGAAIDRAFRGAAETTDNELERYPEGVPVEIFEGPSGAPFVVFGGRRRPLRGLPMPYPVSAEQMQLFPEGDELNVSAANVARARFDDAVSGRFHMNRAKAAITKRGGVVPAARALVKRGTGKARRVARRIGK